MIMDFLEKYGYIIFLTITACAAVFVIIMMVWAIFDTWHRKVERTSARYSALLALNKQFCFDNELRDKYEYKKRVKSKAQLDYFNYTKFFMTIVEDRMPFFNDLVTRVENNRQLYTIYKLRLNSLPSEINRNTFYCKGISFSRYQKIERKLITKSTLNPVVSPLFVCCVAYTSPKGRNSYSAKQMFSCDELMQCINDVRKKAEFKETKEYQRRVMTNSLRYDIMKRDHFKCVICGRGADDGVKLHVDHIFPVSKGGKTVASNLRTLCSDCNSGKSDKWDETGVN